MSVEVSLQGQVLVVAVRGAVSGSDITTIAHSLAESGGRAADGKSRLALLAIVSGDVGMPSEEAKRAMRSNRDLMRGAFAEMHVVMQKGGVLAQLGRLVAGASRLLPGRRPRAYFHNDEAQARRALSAAGYAV